MKKDWTVGNKIEKRDTCIEVINFQYSNEILNFGWLEKGYADRNTVGYWKIKKLK